MKLTSFPASKRITIENIALRGYRLKNSYVYGLVLNVGNENKCLFNSSGSPYFSDIKKDSVYARWQKIIMIVAVVIGLIASLIMSWVTTAQRNKSDGFNSAILGDRDNFKQFIENFFPLFLNFLSACPLSFCLIAKLVLHFYSKFIEWDVHAYTNKSIPTYVNDPRKLEALSGIEHLFASKNGVMTDNHLIFKMCSIGDIIYGTEDSNDKRTTFERVDGFNFKDHRLLDDILENNVNGVQAQELFKAIAC